MTIKPISECPNPLNGVYNPTPEMAYAAGYRLVPPKPAIPDGFTETSCVLGDGDGVMGAWVQTVRPTADILAEQAAAEALRKATPQVLDYPLEMPSLILQTMDAQHGAELRVSDDLEMVMIEAHASPMKSKAERDALARAKFAKRADLNAKGKAGINGQLQARLENIERFLGWRV